MDQALFNQHFEKSKALVSEQRYKDALIRINQALEIYAYNPDALSHRGVVYFHLGDNQNALNDLNRSQNLDPNNAYRYSSRAFVKASIKDFKGAIQDYEKAIELDPEDDIAYNNLGLVQEQLSYWKEAQQNFKKADELAGIEHKAPQHPINKKAEGKTEKKTNQLWRVMVDVFTKKEVRQEFFQFITSYFTRK